MMRNLDRYDEYGRRLAEAGKILLTPGGMRALSASGKPAEQVPEAAEPEEGITESASELLRTVDAGGVPAFVTNQLRRIAEENGIAIEDSWTPNDVVDAIRAKTVEVEEPKFPSGRKRRDPSTIPEQFRPRTQEENDRAVAEMLKPKPSTDDREPWEIAAEQLMAAKAAEPKDEPAAAEPTAEPKAAPAADLPLSASDPVKETEGYSLGLDAMRARKAPAEEAHTAPQAGEQPKASVEPQSPDSFNVLVGSKRYENVPGTFKDLLKRTEEEQARHAKIAQAERMAAKENRPAEERLRELENEAAKAIEKESLEATAIFTANNPDSPARKGKTGKDKPFEPIPPKLAPIYDWQTKGRQGPAPLPAPLAKQFNERAAAIDPSKANHFPAIPEDDESDATPEPQADAKPPAEPMAAQMAKGGYFDTAAPHAPQGAEAVQDSGGSPGFMDAVLGRSRLNWDTGDYEWAKSGRRQRGVGDASQPRGARKPPGTTSAAPGGGRAASDAVDDASPAPSFVLGQGAGGLPSSSNGGQNTLVEILAILKELRDMARTQTPKGPQPQNQAAGSASSPTWQPSAMLPTAPKVTPRSVPAMKG